MKIRDLELSDHSVERFCQRIAPQIPDAQARALLEERLPDARRMKSRSINGDMLYRLDDPSCVLVVRPAREDRRPMVVTILPPGAQEVHPDEPPPPNYALGPTLWLLKYSLERPRHEQLPADLAPAIERLAYAVDNRPEMAARPAAPLLCGFAILAAASPPRRRRKLEALRDGLRELLADGPSASVLEAIELWTAVARLAWEETRQAPMADRVAWEATARVWDVGLRILRRAR